MNSKFIRRSLISYSILSFLVAITTVTIADAMSSAPKSSFSGPQSIKMYYRDIQDLNRVYIFKNSQEYFQRFHSFYAHWLSKLQKVDFSHLNKEDQVDFLLLKRNILRDQYQLKQNQDKWNKIHYAVPFETLIIRLQQKRRRGTTLDAMATADTLHLVIQSIAKAQKAVNHRPLPTEDLRDFTIKTIQQLRRGLQNVNHFYQGYDPEYTWWMKTTYPNTDSSLAAYVQWLKKQRVAQPGQAVDSSGIIGHPVGKEAIERGLRFQMIPYTPKKLISIAHQQYAWCIAKMKEASREMGFGDDWKKALEKVKHDHLKPGEQPEAIHQLEDNAIHFIDSLHLVTIPPLAKEAWRMDMLTPAQMQYASYFLGGSEILVAYAHDTQSFPTKREIMRSGNHAFAHAEVFHELIPGHNLQFFMNNRYRSYRRHFSSPFSVEGWAFYWEMILWDKGYNQTPAEKIGALFWRMTRCARIVFSLKYHLGEWTPQKCIDYLVDKVGLERVSAASEVRRSFTGGYGPLYQLAYMCGALQLYALHHEMVDSGKRTDRQFNDAFLQNGTIPIEMFRAILTKQKLSRDFTTDWKFAKNL